MEKFGNCDGAPLLSLELLPELFQLRFQLGIPAVPGSLLPLGSGQPVLQLPVLGKIPKNPPEPRGLLGFAKFPNGEEFQEFFAGFQESGRWEKWEFWDWSSEKSGNSAQKSGNSVGILQGRWEFCRKNMQGEGRGPQKLGLVIKGKAGKAGKKKKITRKSRVKSREKLGKLLGIMTPFFSQNSS